MNTDHENHQLDSNVFLLTFRVSKHQGKERIVSKHPNTGEFIFPSNDWTDLAGGEIKTGISYHCTLRRPQSDGRFWIAIPCSGLSLPAEAKGLEIEAARLEKREQELNARAQKLESLHASIVKRTNTLEEQESALHQEQTRLNREKASLEPYRNALAAVAKRISDAQLEVIDIMAQVDKLNRKLPKDARLNTANFLDRMRAELTVPKLSDIAPTAQKTETPKRIFRFPKLNFDAVGWR